MSPLCNKIRPPQPLALAGQGSLPIEVLSYKLKISVAEKLQGFMQCRSIIAIHPIDRLLQIIDTGREKQKIACLVNNFFLRISMHG